MGGWGRHVAFNPPLCCPLSRGWRMAKGRGGKSNGGRSRWDGVGLDCWEGPGCGYGGAVGMPCRRVGVQPWLATSIYMGLVLWLCIASQCFAVCGVIFFFPLVWQLGWAQQRRSILGAAGARVAAVAVLISC